MELELERGRGSDESSSSRGRFDSALLTSRAAISWAFCLASRMLSSSFLLWESAGVVVSELSSCSSWSSFMAVESFKISGGDGGGGWVTDSREKKEASGGKQIFPVKWLHRASNPYLLYTTSSKFHFK